MSSTNVNMTSSQACSLQRAFHKAPLKNMSELSFHLEGDLCSVADPRVHRLVRGWVGVDEGGGKYGWRMWDIYSIFKKNHELDS